jgi:S-disulfanyl-L-cysteine oxidoreductase SoxD
MRAKTPERPGWRTLLSWTLAALTASVAGCDSRGSSLLRPDDPAVVAAGQRVYRAHCAACHGASLEGQPQWRERDARGRLPAPPHDASGHTWHHPDAVLLEIMRDGVAKAAGQPDYPTDMPAYKGVLSDEDIIAVLSYIKAQWPADIRRLHDEVNAQQRTAARRP